MGVLVDVGEGGYGVVSAVWGGWMCVLGGRVGWWYREGGCRVWE